MQILAMCCTPVCDEMNSPCSADNQKGGCESSFSGCRRRNNAINDTKVQPWLPPTFKSNPPKGNPHPLIHHLHQLQSRGRQWCWKVGVLRDVKTCQDMSLPRLRLLDFPRVFLGSSLGSFPQIPNVDMVGTSNSKDRSLRQVRRRKERHSLRERSGGQNPADLDGEFEVKLRKWIEYIEDQ